MNRLLEVATFVAARKMGVTLDDLIDRQRVSKRTAQRILHTLEQQFADTATSFDEDGRKRWRLETGALRDLLTLTPDELALDLSIDAFERASQGLEAEHLRSLRDKTIALVPRNRLDALLEAQGLAGPPAQYRGLLQRSQQPLRLL